MKKILIVNNNMHIGGVQKALVSLLWSIRTQYEITLLLFSGSGECLQDIPPEVKVVTVQSAYRYLGMSNRDAHSFQDRLGRGFYAALTRVLGRQYAIALMSLTQKKIEGYDVAISYLHNGSQRMFYGGCNDFVLKHTAAVKKITFLHCDYAGCGADNPGNKKQYAKFNYIAACSQGCADRFLQANPEFETKITVVPNCHRFEDIQKKAAEAPVALSEGKCNIVTVARLGKEKGVERALRVIARMGHLKEKLHYYVIGDGIQKPLLQQILQEEALEHTVTLCGEMENPYGYINAADLLLIPSYSEAAPLVIGEAAFLETPVLSMKTSSAQEMIEDSGFGWVCENTENAMQDALEQLLKEPALLEKKKKLLKNNSLNNKDAISQFEKLIEAS